MFSNFSGTFNDMLLMTHIKLCADISNHLKDIAKRLINFKMTDRWFIRSWQNL